MYKLTSMLTSTSTYIPIYKKTVFIRKLFLCTTHTIYKRHKCTMSGIFNVTIPRYWWTKMVVRFAEATETRIIIISFLSTWLVEVALWVHGSDLEKCSEDLGVKCLSRRRRHRRDMPVRSHLANRRRRAETSGDHSANFGPVRSIWQNTDHVCVVL